MGKEWNEIFLGEEIQRMINFFGGGQIDDKVEGLIGLVGTNSQCERSKEVWVLDTYLALIWLC